MKQALKNPLNATHYGKEALYRCLLDKPSLVVNKAGRILVKGQTVIKTLTV